MKEARVQFWQCAWLLALSLVVGACGNSSSKESALQTTQSKSNPSTTANPQTTAASGCAAMTPEISAITGLKLRKPLELHAPKEGLLRGCTWSEEDGGLHTFGITKEPASKYIEHDEDKYRKAYPDRFKELEGFGEKAFLSPMAFDGWTACALRGSECFCVEIMGEATTAEQATKLLRLALNQF